jgi:hypothetical protein
LLWRNQPILSTRFSLYLFFSSFIYRLALK